MSPKLIGKFTIGHLFIILGLLSAILTFVLFKSILQPAPSKTVVEKEEKKTKPVVVAKRYIIAGEMIQPEDVIAINWPADFYPRQRVYTNVSNLIGHTARIDIVASQPIYQQSVSDGVSLGGLRAMIPKGKRAITIGVSELKGVAGFIRPGDRVDILATFDYPGLSNDSGIPVHVTQTLLQNVQVLAVAQNMTQPRPLDDEEALSGAKETLDKAGKDAKTAKDATEGKSSKASNSIAENAQIAASLTLAVSPSEAQVLTLAEGQARLKLILRPEVEEENVALQSSSEPDMLTDESLFQKVYSYVMSQSSMVAMISASATAASSNAASNVNAAASSGSLGQLGNMGGGTFGGSAPPIGGPNPGKRVQVIEGTSVTDVYVQPR